ncbi:MAG: hypothetical protein KKF46_06650 [Nanoarchaeota archaeon]|nr:hypothetical protein [Nanoarchaeota archaeon]MBU1322009.1 hypothetical protein [Nanoarchaeota archaeon]MBU1598094.1 hypothetical protein [Nanoarchaeota archaeon]MBU2441777.1 hypothetical protein [Nanoarchaeota archaeon]
MNVGDILNKEEDLVVHINRIETADEKDKTRIVMNIVPFGEYSVVLPNNVAKKLWPGETLEAILVLTPSELTDFIGQKPEPYDVVTASYVLDELKTPQGDIIYKRKTKKRY